MKCNDGGGGREGGDASRRTRHRSSSISRHAFGFSQPKIPLRFFRSSGRCQLFGRASPPNPDDRALSIHHPREISAIITLLPSSFSILLDFSKEEMERNGETDRILDDDDWKWRPMQIANGSPIQTNTVRAAQKRRMQMEEGIAKQGDHSLEDRGEKKRMSIRTGIKNPRIPEFLSAGQETLAGPKFESKLIENDRSVLLSSRKEVSRSVQYRRSR